MRLSDLTAVLLRLPAFAIQAFLVCVVIIARAFKFDRYAINEVDRLPSLRQIANPEWLPQDWYLNLDIGYRHLFNRLFGFLTQSLGFQPTAVVGRLLLYGFFAIALVTLIRSLRLRLSLLLLALWLFFLHDQTMGAAEWMVWSVETKTIAYALALLAVATFFERRYALGWAFGGGALSFHPLIGAYAFYCLLATFAVLNRRDAPEWRRMARSSGWALLTGAIGLKVIADSLFAASMPDASRAWEIYVGFRLPHHLMPDALVSDTWKWLLPLATVLFGGLCFSARSRAVRFLAVYCLAAISLFAIGVVLAQFGATELMRFYWFRYPDVIVPLFGYLTAALLLSDLLAGRALFEFRARLPRLQLAPRFRRPLAACLTVGAAVLIAHSALRIEEQFPKLTASRYWGRSDPQPMLNWIRANTPDDAIFLVNPTMSTFYIHAQRAMFVSLKHFPQSPPEILEWYRRITLVNAGGEPRHSYPQARQELRTNFFRMRPKAIRAIAREDGVRYLLGRADQNLPFPIVYRTGQAALYEIGP